MSCPVPENFVVRKSHARKYRPAVIRLQKLQLIPTNVKWLRCKLWQYNIVSFEFLMRHGCLFKNTGCPCAKLEWTEWIGFPEFSPLFLQLFGWGKQYKKLRLGRQHYLLTHGLTEKARKEVLEGLKRRK